MTIYQEIAEKRRVLRREYGGLMSPAALTRELGYRRAREAAVDWADAHGCEKIQRGKRIVYDTDQVAKAIVMARGVTQLA